MSDNPPRQPDPEETINEENEVDEASFESFPASDPPASTGTYAGKTDVSKEDDSDADDEEE